jgi:hypothetical protein
MRRLVHNCKNPWPVHVTIASTDELSLSWVEQGTFGMLPKRITVESLLLRCRDVLMAIRCCQTLCSGKRWSDKLVTGFHYSLSSNQPLATEI